jgi:small subunit ribosomal protein S9
VSEEQSTPLIDPKKVEGVIKATSVQVGSMPAENKKPTAAELKPGEFCWGTGRRKSAIARVRIRPGKGKIQVNGKKMENYFPDIQDQNDVRSPLTCTDTVSRYDIFVKVHGGGIAGQAGAARLGLSRALCIADPDCFPKLRDGGYLTRDGRMKERKKYGQKGARKRFQFSKR